MRSMTTEEGNYKKNNNKKKGTCLLSKMPSSYDVSLISIAMTLVPYHRPHKAWSKVNNFLYRGRLICYSNAIFGISGKN